MASDFHKFIGYSRRFFSGTLLSRFTGLFRDIALAYSFGDHPSVAAFMVAFRLSQFFRRIFGEGSLQNVFTPHYEELRLQSDKEASFFFRDLNRYLAGILTLVIVVSACCFFILSKVPFMVGFKEIFSLSIWMMPSLLFVCLYTLNMATLQCHGSYFLASVAPALGNITWIIACFAISSANMPRAMLLFSLFVILGFFFQWMLTAPKTVKTLHLSWKTWFTSSQETSRETLKKISKAFFLTLVGVGATQINSTLDAFFARIANPKGPIYLWYAIRLEQIPLALFGIAIVSAVAPTLAKLIKSKLFGDAYNLFSKIYIRLGFFMLVFTFAFLALGTPLITFFFRHGQFYDGAIFSTVHCLWAYGFGLVPSAMILLVCTAFYAFSDYKIPMKASLIAVGMNLFLNALFTFIFSWREIGIAFATSVSSWFNLWYLQRALQKRGFNPVKVKKEFVKIVIASSLSAILTLVVEQSVFKISSLAFSSEAPVVLPSTFFGQMLYLMTMGFTFMTSLLVSAWLLRAELFFHVLKEFFFIRIHRKKDSTVEIPDA